MAVTYKFASLASVADYFNAKAAELREQSKRTSYTLKAREKMNSCAAAWEAAAHTIGNTELPSLREQLDNLTLSELDDLGIVLNDRSAR